MKQTGKANRTTCWYSQEGKEEYTKDFSWIVSNANLRLFPNDGHFDPPANALIITTCPYYCILARTQWGLIPGKATRNSAYYPYDCKEHKTDDFDWIVLE